MEDIISDFAEMETNNKGDICSRRVPSLQNASAEQERALLQGRSERAAELCRARDRCMQPARALGIEQRVALRMAVRRETERLVCV